MPGDDARLEQALHDAAPVVEPTGVLDRVAAKRVRRRRQRRLATAASALALVVVVVTTAVLVTRDDGSSPQVATPGTGLSAHVVTGDDARRDGTVEVPQRVALDADPGVLVAPVTVGSSFVSTASHDRGADGLPLTHVVRINGTHVVDVVNFKAEVVSIAEGEGARWALTRNLRPTGGTLPDTFLKRIGTVGDPVSMMLPLDADPVGPIAAIGGAVWVPLRDGVLQYDPVTLALERRIDLPRAAVRDVAQAGKLAAVTDGNAIVQLDPSRGLGARTEFGPGVLGLAAAGFDGRVLLAGEDDDADRARVARADSADPVRVAGVMPSGFRAERIAASSTRWWVTGTVDGAPAIVLLTADGVRATVVLDNSRTASMVWTAPQTVTVVTDGRLFTISLP